MDKESEDFLNSVYINKNILPKELEIKSRDSAGYVTETSGRWKSVGR